MEHKRPIGFHVVEVNTFLFTREQDRQLIQLQLVTTFPQEEGQLWVLVDFWTRKGVVSGNSTSYFNWSQEHNSTSRLCCHDFFIDIFLPLIMGKFAIVV